MFSIPGGRGWNGFLRLFLWPPTCWRGLITATTLSYWNVFCLVLFFPLEFWTKTKLPQTLNIKYTYKQNLCANPDWLLRATPLMNICISYNSTSENGFPSPTRQRENSSCRQHGPFISGLHPEMLLLKTGLWLKREEASYQEKNQSFSLTRVCVHTTSSHLRPW